MVWESIQKVWLKNKNLVWDENWSFYRKIRYQMTKEHFYICKIWLQWCLLKWPFLIKRKTVFCLFFYALWYIFYLQLHLFHSFFIFSQPDLNEKEVVKSIDLKFNKVSVLEMEKCVRLLKPKIVYEMITKNFANVDNYSVL